MNQPLSGLLHTTSAALKALHRPFALVGGLALSVRAEPRFTRDADFAVAVSDDAEAEDLIRSLGAHGLVPFAIVEQQATGRLATARMRTENGMICDLLLATCGIEAQIVTCADPIEVVPGLVLPVATVPHLIAMKVLSESADRRQDGHDIQSLLLTQPSVDEIFAALDEITLRGCHRQQDLRTKFEAYLQRRST